MNQKNYMTSVDDLRVGIGYDCHKLIPKRKLYIGGVHIPSRKGALGVSDADVMIHSVIDALLGATGMRDIGYFFPPRSKYSLGKRSTIFLKKIIKKINSTGFQIINIDSVIILDKPHISKYIPIIKKTMGNILNIKKECVNIKGKTTEGKGENNWIECYAVILVKKLKKTCNYRMKYI